MARTTEHPFLSGNYAPVPDETTVTSLPIHGTFPASLAGRYLRIGPNPIGNTADDHEWHLGDGMVHSITLQAGSAAYRNRWVMTDPASRRLGTEPVSGPSGPEPDRSNEQLVLFDRSLYALSTGALAYQLAPGLETVRRVDVLGDGRTACVPPVLDPRSGDLLAVSRMASGDHVLVRVAAGGRAPSGPWAVAPEGGPVLSLSVTPRWVVVLGDGVIGVATHEWERPFTWLDTGAGVVEPVAAADDGDRLVLHVTAPGLERWTVDRSARRVDRIVLDPRPQSTAHGQFGPAVARYAVTHDAPSGLPSEATAIHRHDLASGRRVTHDFGSGHHPVGFQFVPDPAPRNPDVGWLVGLVHDDSSNRTSLVVLDGVDPTAVLATVALPRRIPYGFGGIWLPGAG